MSEHTSDPETARVISASCPLAAAIEVVFELIADPANHPRWDGNDNLARADAGQRVTRVGDVFSMTLTKGSVRENHVTVFEEGRAIAWRPAPVGEAAPGHEWRWDLEPLEDGRTLVTHTYDWTRLEDPARLAKARAMSEANLSASLERLAALAEEGARS